MKFKNGSKRFLTLNPNNSEGFTLVELIVVIAILAILAGVAVPAYNGYIEKANKQADVTLVRNLKYTMEIAVQTGNLEEGSYVILYNEEKPELSGEGCKTAVVDAFGTTYEDSLRLTYSNWGNSVIALLIEQGYDVAKNVADSSFANIGGQLVSDTQGCTDAVLDFLNSKSYAGDSQTLMDKLGAYTGDEFYEVLEDAGLATAVKDSAGNVLSYTASKDLTSQQLSNAIILSVANETNGNTTAVSDMTAFWIDGTSLPSSYSSMTGLATSYAYYEAITAYMNHPELNAAFASMQSAISDLNNVNTGESNSDALGKALYALQTIDATVVKIYADGSADGASGDAVAAMNKLNSYYEDQAAKDAAAYVAMMQAVAGQTEKYGTAQNLGTAGIYSTDMVQSDIGAYLTAAKIASAAGKTDGLSENSVIVFCLDGKIVSSIDGIE